MSATCIEGISTNPEILAIADRVFGTVRLSIQRATNALNTVPSTTVPQKGIEKDALDFLKKYRTVNRSAVARLSGLSRAGGRQLHTTIAHPSLPLLNPDFASPQTVLQQAKVNKYFDGLKLSGKTLADAKWSAATHNFLVPGDKNAYAAKILEALAFKRVLPGISSGAPVPSAAPAKAKELHLKLSSLKAVHRFGWEITDFGDDSMASGGDGVDSVQQHVTAPAFFIHTFKKDGENFDIRPDRTFVKFDLNRIGPWPRSFIANVFVAEKDASGGFIEFLQKLWDAIGSEVVSIASTLAVAATGAAIGSLVGSDLMPLVGTIVGAVVGAVIGLVVGWMLDSLKDDIFESPDNPLGLVLPSQESLFPGNSRTSPTYMQDFTLGSARYLMSYYWELVF